MIRGIAIHNNTNSSSRQRQETLRQLAKNVLEGASQKERDIKQVIENREDYITAKYIPSETVICSLGAQAYYNDKLKNSLNFLNNKAAVKTLTTAPKYIYNEGDTEIFNIELDESKNIFAA